MVRLLQSRGANTNVRDKVKLRHSVQYTLGCCRAGGRGAANGTQAHVVGKQWASLVSSVAVEKLQALQGACEQVLRGEKDKRPALMEAWSTGRMQDLYIYAILHHSPAHPSLYYLFIYLLTYHSSIHLFISMQS